MWKISPLTYQYVSKREFKMPSPWSESSHLTVKDRVVLLRDIDALFTVTWKIIVHVYIFFIIHYNYFYLQCKKNTKYIPYVFISGLSIIIFLLEHFILRTNILRNVKTFRWDLCFFILNCMFITVIVSLWLLKTVRLVLEGLFQ